LRCFENEHPSIHPEKAEFLKLKRLLKETLPLRQLENPEFFNSQIIDQIRREADTKSRSTRRPLLGLPRAAWGGICALSLGLALFFTLIPRQDLTDPHAKYVAEVLKAKPEDPKGKATVEIKKDMTVIKLETLDKLPVGQSPRR